MCIRVIYYSISYIGILVSVALSNISISLDIYIEIRDKLQLSTINNYLYKCNSSV